jgi:hypothetical protein
MNRYVPKSLVLLCGCAAASLLTGFATPRAESLRTSVFRLEDTSRHFSSQISYHGDDSGRVSRGADALAQASRNLGRALEKGDSHENVETDYQLVTVGYEQLHSQLPDESYGDSHWQVLTGFDLVTEAYRDVEAGMSRR